MIRPAESGGGISTSQPHVHQALPSLVDPAALARLCLPTCSVGLVITDMSTTSSRNLPCVQPHRRSGAVAGQVVCVHGEHYSAEHDGAASFSISEQGLQRE